MCRWSSMAHAAGRELCDQRYDNLSGQQVRAHVGERRPVPRNSVHAAPVTFSRGEKS